MDVLTILGVFALSLTLGLLGAMAVLETVLYLMTHAPSQRERRIADAPQTTAAFLADDVRTATLHPAA
jgi:hypothetical protein